MEYTLVATWMSPSKSFGQGFPCSEGNLVLSDGGIAIGVTCRVRDFNGWAWSLFGTDHVLSAVYRTDFILRAPDGIEVSHRSLVNL